MTRFNIVRTTTLFLAVMTAMAVTDVPTRAAGDDLIARVTPDSESLAPPTNDHHRSRSEILKISRRIDELVRERLSENGLEPNPPTSDAVFLRRAYLQIAGRIPTMQEAETFFDDKRFAENGRGEGGDAGRKNRRTKRADLVDALLLSDAHVSHQFNFWADLLRIKQRLQGGVSGMPYKDFVKDALASNMPYDELVRALITADGPALQRGNGATGYYLRDKGMPEDNMSNTIRIFLGTRLECAQCHDHPFDSWTQREYFQMVAFTGGLQMQVEPYNSPRAREIREAINDKTLSSEERRKLRRVLQPLNQGVSGGGNGLARLPEDYQYDDGEPLEIVKAHAIFDTPPITIDPMIPKPRSGKNKRAKNKRRQQIQGAKDIGSRQVYADWLTSPENPRFARTMANRIWKYVMGVGLIEPVDDMNDQTVASNPKLMDYLTRQLIDLDFDLKQFQRAIYLSNTFQAQSVKSDLDPERPYHFPGPIVRRMTAEQLWDSFCTMTVADVDARENALRPKGLYNGRLVEGDIYAAYEELKAKPLDEIKTLAGRARKKENERMKAAAKQTRDSRARVNRQQRELRSRIAKARQNKDAKKVRRLQAELQGVMEEARETFAFRDFVRASELYSPMRPGHFLREFGQSDREQIDNANDEPAVTQVLSLMNGLLEQRIVNNPYSMLMKNVTEARPPEDRLDAAFLTILSRYPTARERQIWTSHVADGGEPRDIIWVLANTHEFMFVQ